MSVTKAVIPAAGLGTRFLPATKAIPRSCCPSSTGRRSNTSSKRRPAPGCYRRPDHHGSRGKTRDRGPLRPAPRDRGGAGEEGRHREARAGPAVHRDGEGALRPPGDRCRARPRGAGGGRARRGRAVRRAARRRHGRRARPAARADDRGAGEARRQRHRADGGARRRWSRSTACATVEPAESSGRYGLVRITDLVEKPPLDEAPSNLAVIGRYLLSPDDLRRPAQDRAGPRRRDPADRRASRPSPQIEPVHGVVFTGRRYDTGDRGDYSRPSCGSPASGPTSAPELWEWLQGLRRGSAATCPNGGRLRREIGRPAHRRGARSDPSAAGRCRFRWSMRTAASLAEDVVGERADPGLRQFGDGRLRGAAGRCRQRDGARRRSRLPVVGDIAAGSNTGHQHPARVLRPHHDRRRRSRPGPTRSCSWSGPTAASRQVVIHQAPRPASAHPARGRGPCRRATSCCRPARYLGAAQIGLLAAAGRASAMCRPRPRVVIVSTGSELVDAGEPLGAGPAPRLQQPHARRGLPRGGSHRVPGRAGAATTRRCCWRPSRTT